MKKAQETILYLEDKISKLEEEIKDCIGACDGYVDSDYDASLDIERSYIKKYKEVIKFIKSRK